MKWTEEMVGKLKLMWDGGCSAREIAFKLGIESRNAIIGKAHRLNLARRTAGRREVQEIKMVNGPPISAVKPLYRPQTASVLPLPKKRRKGKYHLFDLQPNMCRWPFGEGSDIRFCGAPSIGTISPYCNKHHIRAHQRSKPLPVKLTTTWGHKRYFTGILLALTVGVQQPCLPQVPGWPWFGSKPHCDLSTNPGESPIKLERA